jgi:hypothetical protein
LPGLLQHRAVEARLIEKGLLTGLVFDLMEQDILGPAKLALGRQAEFAFEMVFALLKDDEIV